MLDHGQCGVVSHVEVELVEAGGSVYGDECHDVASECGGSAVSGIVCFDQFGHSW